MGAPGRLGAAVVGLGVGEEHARTLGQHATCDLRWVYDLDEAKAQRICHALGGVRVAESYGQLLEDHEVDIISIASFDDAHYEQVVAALQAGKHVFVEKPLCRGLAELGQVKRAWQESGTHLASNLVLRAAPLYRWLKGAIEGGELGEVYAFDGDYLYGRLPKITEGWRKNVESYSVMEGGGIHLLDLMLWLTGQRPVRVSGVGNRISTIGTPFRYNDFTAATFQFDSSLVGRITANFGSVHRHQHVVRVFGTRGTFIYDDQGARFHTTRDPQSRPKALEHSPFPSTRGDLIPDFVRAIQDGSGAADTQSHFDVISACDAVDQAVAEDIPVDVKYL